MPVVLGIDLGKNLGWGLVGRGSPKFGSQLVVKEWSPLGPCMLVLEDRLHRLILQHKPDVVAAARPFVRKSKKKMFDTTQNLIPMYGGYVLLLMVCSSMGVRLETIDESAAREALVGEGNLRRKSAEAKADVMQAFKNQGILVGNDHEGDGLCIAYHAFSKLDPAKSYELTPLFASQPTVRLRRSPRKKAA